MITISCDLCGNHAEFGISAKYGISVNQSTVRMEDHHICQKCAKKLGLLQMERPEDAATPSGPNANDIYHNIYVMEENAND